MAPPSEVERRRAIQIALRLYGETLERWREERWAIFVAKVQRELWQDERQAAAEAWRRTVRRAQLLVWDEERRYKAWCDKWQ